MAIVSSGQSVTTQTVSAGATLTVLGGGTATSTSVLTGGALIVSAGGHEIRGTVYDLASETVYASGSAIGTLVSGDQILSGGLASGATLDGFEAKQIVLSGGKAIATTVGDGAFLLVSAGGVASGAIVSNVISVAGGQAVSATIETSAYGYVLAGGVMSGTTAEAGGQFFVDLGGSGAGTVLDGGTQFVYGSASGTQIRGGGVDQVDGVDTAARISSGGQQVVQGGSAVSATVLRGGQQLVSDFAGGGLVSYTEVESGGREVVETSGLAYATSVGAGGLAEISATASASAAEVQSGGVLLVLSGGSATDTTVDAGGWLVVLPGGSATSSHVSAGGSSGTPGVLLIAPATVSVFAVSASGLSVGSGAALYVESGGTARATSVFSGGTEFVAAGGTDISGTATGDSSFNYPTIDVAGTAIATTAEGLGYVVVESGGSMTSGMVVSNGRADISSGGSAIATTVSNGELDVLQGGVVNGANLLDLGYIAVAGTATAISAVLLGAVEISAGGSVFDATLGLVSDLDVQSGGFASNITLAANLAEFSFEDGATLDGTIGIAPHVLIDIKITGTDTPTALISGFTDADMVDFEAVSYDPAGSVTYSGGTLGVHEGGHDYALNLASSTEFASGSFYFADDGSGGTTVGFVGPSSHIVSSGHSGSGFFIPGDAELQVRAGGTASDATLSGTGTLITYAPDPSDGGSLLITDVAQPMGLEENSGTDSGAVIERGGNMINQGTAVSTQVASGGLMFAISGAVHYATVAAGGILLAEGAGATTLSTTLDGGLEGLAGGAAATGTVVNSGGAQVVAGAVQVGSQQTALPSGIASGTTLNAGGKQFVNLSGSAYATHIAGGGEMVVTSGGSAFAPVLGASATMQLGSGAAVVGGIAFDGGGVLLAVGGTTMPATTISGFALNDAIELQTIAAGDAATATIDAETGVLTVTAAGGTETLTLAGSYSGVSFEAVPDGATGLYVAEAGSTLPTSPLTPPCFAAGTRIATARGDVPVEALRPGDHVRLAGGGTRPVVWTGHRAVDCTRHPRPHDVWPVRVCAGAFGPAMPAREIRLSPDHAVSVRGVLIPVRYLLNGRTIAQVRAARVVYWHVELDRHDVLLAEGLPAESYLDTGNRDAFANGGPAVRLQPSFARAVWDAQGCAPLVLEGPALHAARRRLLRRAASLGHRITTDPGLRVEADGRTLRASRDGSCWRVRLPADVAGVRLVSRDWVPAHTRAAESDTRRLGVAISRIRLDGRQVALDSPGFGAGWHAPEAQWRWTDGDAGLSVAGMRELAFAVAMAGSYWREEPAAAGKGSALSARSQPGPI